MRLHLAGFCVLVLISQTAIAQERPIKVEMVNSHFLGADRTIRIYLPPSYEEKSNRRYPVLYLHDGQNVFSSAGTNAAFGWGSWELDKTVDRLCRAGKMQEIIMVAVDNSRARYQEYCGRTTVERGLSQAAARTNANQRGDFFNHSRQPDPLRVETTRGPHAVTESVTTERTPFENYASFLATELKPKIDREYRTRPDAAHTGVMGSSLGGICSLALAWEHPDIFGCAASLSGAFQVDHTNFLNGVLRNYHGEPKPIRIYLDSGTVDFTGGDDGRALTGEVAAKLRRIGWKRNLKHYVDSKPLTEAELEETGLRRDKWNEAQTSQHNEFYWRLRSWRALCFLFSPRDK